jgi:hypothetical protein
MEKRYTDEPGTVRPSVRADWGGSIFDVPDPCRVQGVFHRPEVTGVESHRSITRAGPPRRGSGLNWCPPKHENY